MLAGLFVYRYISIDTYVYMNLSTPRCFVAIVLKDYWNSHDFM